MNTRVLSAALRSALSQGRSMSAETAARSGCPLCGSPSQHGFTATDHNEHTTEERFDYRRCSSCHAYFLADRPQDVSIYYPKGYYQRRAPARQEWEARFEQPKLDLLRPFVTAGKLIDVGAGHGEFCSVAQRAGFEVVGIEMDADGCQIMRAEGINTIHNDDPGVAMHGLGPADVICMWHVVEHLKQPWDVLSHAVAELRDGGVLSIAMPNPDSMGFRLLKGRFAHVDAPRHLFLIPPRTLREHLEALGLHQVFATTRDPVGLHNATWAWEEAIRSAVHREWFAKEAGRVLAVSECRKMKGATYTAIFVRSYENGRLPDSHPSG